MKWIVEVAAIWLVLKWLVPLLILLGIALYAAHWARERNTPHFTSSEGRREEPRDRR